MATRRSPKGERARQRIVAEGLGLFARRGFYGTSVRDLASRLGTPTASLLHHFPTKERLYGAVLDLIAADLQERLETAVAGGEDDAARLRRVTHAFVDWMIERPDSCNLLLRELLDNPDRLQQGETDRRPLRFHLAPVLARIAAFLAGGARRGAFVDADPLFFVIHVAGAVSYFCAARPTLARISGSAARLDPDRFRADLTSFVERSILTQESP